MRFPWRLAFSQASQTITNSAFQLLGGKGNNPVSGQKVIDCGKLNSCPKGAPSVNTCEFKYYALGEQSTFLYILLHTVVRSRL
jgi:hypothetical protein